MIQRQTPPLAWLFATPDKRRAAVQYWLIDTIAGGSRALLHHLLRLLPIDLCSWIGAEMVRLTRRLYPASDKRARHLIASLYGSHDTDRAMHMLWRSVSRTMTEYSVLDRLWPAGRVSVVGREHLDEVTDAGRSIIVAGLHLGNWEVIGAALTAIGHPGAGFYEPPVNRFDDRIAKQVRERYGGTVVFPSYLSGATAHRILTETRDGFLIYADEIFHGRVSAPALGRPLRIEGNIAHIAKLARLTGAAVIPGYCLRLADSARFKLVFLPVVPIVHSDDRKADLLANVAAINAAIEPVIRAHADQWYYALDFEPE